jgi:hypothetical protein
MIGTALWPLQVAIYQRLSNDLDISKLVSGVYDKASEGTEYPYILTGEPIVTPMESKTSYIENIPWTLHAYSNYSGKKQAYELLDKMMKALTRSEWNVPGYKVYKFNIEPNGAQVITDIDGVTYHAILRVRFYIEKI